MRTFLIKFLFAAFLLVSATAAQAQTLKFDELLTSFVAPKYPVSVFEMIANRGFERIDKQWLPKCDRVIYYLAKEGNPSVFVSPTKCFEMEWSAHFPKYYRNEMEVQFQKSSRSEFETLKAQVKKQCKLVGTQKSSESGDNSAGSSVAYHHEASGVTIVVEDSAAVAFVYFIK